MASVKSSCERSDVSPDVPNRSPADDTKLEVDPMSPPNEPAVDAASRRLLMPPSSVELRFDT